MRTLTHIITGRVGREGESEKGGRKEGRKETKFPFWGIRGTGSVIFIYIVIIYFSWACNLTILSTSAHTPHALTLTHCHTPLFFEPLCARFTHSDTSLRLRHHRSLAC
ncbi:hypothetical protein L873DRAFT_121995 [Choiromyces venosus 120613-1]|uniref:Uncharacterized protein n=1 Tax=Choiromyces venosus 120613-1 TaxID=1336337 RepID=A0A3N4J7L6_9PEZI|nr:hypothetical protein L873DRAFT_121995 [Choiromyces venosus 120613-1]